jgi:hypothetical protein
MALIVKPAPRLAKLTSRTIVELTLVRSRETLPRMALNVRYTDRFDLRLTPKQKRLFQQAARRAEMRLTEWIRERLKAAAERDLAK